MKIIRCPKGHPYSENLTECPTCANELSMVQYDDPPAADDSAADVDDAGADSIVDQDPGFARDDGRDDGDTEPPDESSRGSRSRGARPFRPVPGGESPRRDPGGGWFSRAARRPDAPAKSAGEPIEDRGGRSTTPSPPSSPAGSRPSSPVSPGSRGGSSTPARDESPRRPPRDPQLGERDPVDHTDRVKVHAVDRRKLRVAAFLVMLDGSEPGRFFAIFEGTNSIGKASNPDNAIPIPVDKYVSRRHAEIEYRAEDGAVFILRDLGSSNGTYLNDDPRRIAPEEDVALLPGDVVRIGRTRLRFQPLYP